MRYILLFAGLTLVLLPGYALLHASNIFWGMIFAALVSGGFSLLTGGLLLFAFRDKP